jgi:hypothetical protein
MAVLPRTPPKRRDVAPHPRRSSGDHPEPHPSSRRSGGRAVKAAVKRGRDPAAVRPPLSTSAARWPDSEQRRASVAPAAQVTPRPSARPPSGRRPTPRPLCGRRPTVRPPSARQLSARPPSARPPSARPPSVGPPSSTPCDPLAQALHGTGAPIQACQGSGVGEAAALFLCRENQGSWIILSCIAVLGLNRDVAQALRGAGAPIRACRGPCAANLLLLYRNIWFDGDRGAGSSGCGRTN